VQRDSVQFSALSAVQRGATGEEERQLIQGCSKYTSRPRYHKNLSTWRQAATRHACQSWRLGALKLAVSHHVDVPCSTSARSSTDACQPIPCRASAACAIVFQEDAALTDSVNWTCPTCNVTVTTGFCARCGEEPLAPRDLTLRGLGEKLLHALTSIDARAMRSAWKLLRHPGELTQAWTRGVRKSYVAPLQLFLIANVLFFGVQWLTGENVFSSSLDSHLHHQDWSELAKSLLARRLEATHSVLEQYEAVFDRAVVLNARSLILLMTIPFALILPLAFFREHRPFMTHVVFSLHLYTFLLLLFSVVLLLASFSKLLGFGGLDAPRVDNTLSIANLAACATYIYLASGPVYGASGILRAAKALLLALAVAAIVLGYRFVLFPLTLYTT
jgi:Protein of unknown function (DUF3667)